MGTKLSCAVSAHTNRSIVTHKSLGDQYLDPVFARDGEVIREGAETGMSRRNFPQSASTQPD
jgi:hypothetical protein